MVLRFNYVPLDSRGKYFLVLKFGYVNREVGIEAGVGGCGFSEL